MLKKFIAICVLASAATASAEFTPAEKIQVAAQFEALNNANKALLGVTDDYLGSHPADAATVLVYTSQLAPALESHFNAVLSLLDQDSVKISRADVLAEAFDGLTKTNYSPASATLDSMIASCIELCTGLQGARQRLSKAMLALGSFDRSLPYAEPRVDSNLMFPVATRDESSWVAPHGDYRRFGRMIGSSVAWMTVAWVQTAQQASLAPDIIGRGNSGLTDVFRKISDLTSKMIDALSLSVAIEPLKYIADIDLQTQNDTTSRGRHFFRAVMALEILINTDHLGESNSEGDVFGRVEQVRGLPYAFNSACRALTSRIEAEAAPITVARARALQALCEWWAHTDNAAANILHLRYNTTFPFRQEPIPATCSDGGCCGENTRWNGSQCVALGSVPELVLIDPVTAQARCVEGVQ